MNNDLYAAVDALLCDYYLGDEPMGPAFAALEAAFRVIPEPLPRVPTINPEFVKRDLRMVFDHYGGVRGNMGAGMVHSAIQLIEDLQAEVDRLTRNKP